MSTPDRILAFIPAYRCAPQVVRVLRQFQDPAVHGHFAEIMVVDNVSPDQTVAAAIDEARALGLGKVSVVRNHANYGLGGSHKAAFGYAIANGFSHVMVLHGDDQGNVADIIPVLAAGRHHDYDCCLGARFHPDSRIEGYSPTRVLGNHVFNRLFSAACGRKLHDLGSGLNLYRTEHLRSGYWHKFHDNLMFNYCMILAHVKRKDSLLFFPISWREEDQVSNVKLFSQARRTLGLLGSYLKNPDAFLAREFRDHPVAEYRFETLAKGL
ncbi:glycosyltransferase family 2 protein [Geomonas nitrogeniifigens]|uniref:glycosyltransferase family 2 protein n=1 Tax=Geomonas diazotrophica TaxID=2843197 RepID=UPI001C2BFFA2|nr:glycosyltransferase family 2 protein [Geomonas nitrogeniifigens]QXE85424.1 glycosyltransferase family 2 protein [Geomonas nitrogeniifigens]